MQQNSGLHTTAPQNETKPHATHFDTFLRVCRISPQPVEVTPPAGKLKGFLSPRGAQP